MTINTESPLLNFSGCHDGILKHLRELADLPKLIESGKDPKAVKQTAKYLEDFYHKVILQHHKEEEEELFTAVSTALHPDPILLAEAKEQIERLTTEHRQVEAMWRDLEPDLKLLAKGKEIHLDKDKVANLVEIYWGHALFEEAVFLPLSARLLDSNGMAALGLSLHIRHLDSTMPAYI